MELGAGNLTGGIWGSFGLNDDASGNELDLWVSYDFHSLALTVTNYSFPGADGTYSTGGVFDGDIEVSGSHSLGPVDLTVGYFTDLELYTSAGFQLALWAWRLVTVAMLLVHFMLAEKAVLLMYHSAVKKTSKSLRDYSLPVFGSFIYSRCRSCILSFGFSL